MKVTTLGIDLAKNVFQLHGVNEYGKTVIKKQIRREQMAEFFANLPACLIGMEACGSAHHWVRKLEGFGHTVKLMAAQFVKPYGNPAFCRVRTFTSNSEMFDYLTQREVHEAAPQSSQNCVGATTLRLNQGFNKRL